MRGELIIGGTHIVTKKREILVHTNNLILDNMYDQLIQLIGGGSSTAYVDRMQFGTGTLAADVTQTFLQTPITPVKTVTNTVDPVLFQVTFQSALLATEGNGFPISEAGLLTSDSILVARAVFSVRAKTSDYVFDFGWTITLQ